MTTIFGLTIAIFLALAVLTGIRFSKEITLSTTTIILCYTDAIIGIFALIELFIVPLIVVLIK